MIRKLWSLTAIVIFSLFATGKVYAAIPVSVNIVQLPEYMNTDNFQISYTAHPGTSGLTSVVLEYHKEGQGWQSLGTFAENARTYNVTPAQINQETKYYFRARATGNDASTDESETSTTIDRSAPPTPEGYSKEKVGSQTYRLRWHNTDSDDVYKVYVYRSDKAGFTADSSTLIAQLNVSKNTDTTWDNAIPEDREYFYVLRGVDRAGNATNPVGDTVVITETTSSTSSGPVGQPVNQGQQYSGQTLGTGTGGSILGEQDLETNDATESSPSDRKNEQLTEDQDSDTGPRKLWPMIGIGALLFAVYWFLFRR